MSETESKLDQLFHPVEHAIISKWLGIEPPVFARDINIYTPELPDGVIGIERDTSGQLSEFSISNTVARIVLSTIQQGLPQWSAHDGDGIVYGRYPYAKHSGRVSLLPQFLFGINWASTAPGFSWPVDYYVGFLPFYDVHVVTASADSPDAFGYNDLALGYFQAGEDILTGSERVIRDNWQRQFDEWQQQRWENLWGIGLISEGRANTLADSVWGENTQEENAMKHETCLCFTLPSRIAYLVATPEIHRKRRRELSLSLLRDGPPEGLRKTMRPEHPPTSDSD